MFSDDIFYLSYDKDIDTEVDKLFKFYRENGFPNYNKDDYSIEKELNKLKQFDLSKIILTDNDKIILKQNLTGIGVLWTYFPHWIDIRCNNHKSLSEMWNDDEQLKILIKKTYLWKLKHNEPHWTSNRIRQNAKVFLSKQSVSNFRPTVAKYIYNTYGNNGRVIDMSGGFGGRALGFASSNCSEYIACEPSSKTFEGLINLTNDLHKIDNKNYIILKQGSEIPFPVKNKSIDLCFTSPPYFDTEKYSYEQSQSYIKYPTIDKWLVEFLRSTMLNCRDALKDDGHMIINIADTTKYDLVKPTIAIAISLGFTLSTSIDMQMSSIAGNKRKIEPILVFKKGS